ncbi:cytochrome P450 71A1-like [Musa acuminata AAA Group]|uniref:cytochrome P450 71A1-like n=1 Tax=Musa acuminata AAA Group TaxID=214697 RepID=UPI0031D46790
MCDVTAWSEMCSGQSTMLSSSLLFALLLLLVLLGTKRAFSKKRRLPPSPPKLPLLGHLLQLGSLPHRSLSALSEKHGPLMLLHFGHVPTLVVSSADMAEEVMRTHDTSFASRPDLKPVRTILYDTHDVGFAPFGDYWRHTRKLCTIHLLSGKRVKSYRALRQEEVAFMMQKISRASLSSTSGFIDMSKVINSFVTDIVGRVVSGTSFRAADRCQLFSKLIDDNGVAFRELCVEELFPSLGFLDGILGLNPTAKKVAKEWDVALNEMIQDHVERLNRDEVQERDFVDELLDVVDKPEKDFCLTMKQMKAILWDMFSAGVEASFTALEWAMAELVRHPETLKKLQDEVRGLAAGKDMVKEDETHDMVYLKAVLKEVLRVHPPTPLLLPRESIEDCQIQGYHIPKKTRVLINAWAIGRDPKHWDAPEEFRPERFMSSDLDFKGKNFEFTPFGSGRRICPGMQLAVATLEVALANLVHQFDWELPLGMTRDEFDMTESPGLTARKKEPLHLVAKPWGQIPLE